MNSDFIKIDSKLVMELSKIDHFKYENINSEYIGYLVVPNLEIQEPVVRGSDNEWYLTHSINNEWDVKGTVFLDSRAISNSFNKVIHGHCLSNEALMFTPILRYITGKTNLGPDVVYFCSEDDIKQYQVFAVMKFDINDLTDFDYLNPDVPENVRSEWFDYIKRNSIWCSNELFENSKLEDLLVLSTCDRPGPTDTRIIVFTVLTDSVSWE